MRDNFVTMEGYSNDIRKMLSLIERMEKPQTPYQALLNESKDIVCETRVLKSANDAFDVMDKIGNNKFVCIGYVTSANLQIPQVKRKNPETNRMKSYDDFETFASQIGHEGEIGAIIKVTSYNIRYTAQDKWGEKYNKYKNGLNKIRGEFGLEPIQDKEGYTQKVDYGKGVTTYGGNNDSLVGRTYSPQNTFGCKAKSMYYLVDTNGNIVGERTKDSVKQYLKAARKVEGVAALEKLGASEEKIEDFKNAVKGLGFSYKNFEFNSILYIAATVDGEKVIYINDNLARCVNDININAQDFVDIAKKRYQEDLKEVEAQEAQQ